MSEAQDGSGQSAQEVGVDGPQAAGDGLDDRGAQQTTQQQQEKVSAERVGSISSKRSLRQQGRKDYSEARQAVEPDTDTDSDDAEPAAKRQRMPHTVQAAQAAALEDYLELETAWAVGFNAQGLSEEEENLLPPGADEAGYVHVRNFVLTKWREDVSRKLSLTDITAALKQRHIPYAKVAYRFLSAAGYINFGIAPALKPDLQQQDKGTVIVVGAGLAGLACARELQRRGFKPVVLEGHDRPGGRVYSRVLQARGMSAVADLGGSILTGIDGNPLAVLVRQLGAPMHEIAFNPVPLYTADGAVADARTDSKAYNGMLDKCALLRDSLGPISDNVSLGTALETLWQQTLPKPADGSSAQAGEQNALERQLLDWHVANLEFANAAEVATLSLSKWDQDDPHELGGAHTFLPGGNIRLVAALAEGLPVLYNSVVTEVRCSASGAVVRTLNHEFQGDAVVVAVPLGVLKAASIRFSPPLPVRKQEAIQRLGFGLLNKVALLFPKAFWGRTDMFGRIPMATASRGEFFLFYSYEHVSGAPLLAALVSGAAAREFEEQQPSESVARLMTVLRGWFEPRGVSVPEPLQAVCTRWGKDPLARGSYSSVAVGALGAEDYDIIAESIGGRLFFAGEATSSKYPATMHGAFESGLRQAANLDATFEQRSQKQRAAAVAVQRHASVEAAQVAAAARLHPHALLQAQQAALLATCLAQVFDNPAQPPDAEFGCCQLMFGPQDTEFDNEALLRVDMGSAKGSRAKFLPLYLVLDAIDAIRLRDVSGGDEGRISMLAGHLGLKLVGRAGLSPRALRMLQALLQHRYGQHQLANALVSLATTQQEQQPVKQEPKQEDSREAASDSSAGRGMLQEAGAHQARSLATPAAALQAQSSAGADTTGHQPWPPAAPLPAVPPAASQQSQQQTSAADVSQAVHGGAAIKARPGSELQAAAFGFDSLAANGSLQHMQGLPGAHAQHAASAHGVANGSVHSQQACQQS